MKNGASHGFGGKQYSLENGETIFYFGNLKMEKWTSRVRRVNMKKVS